MGGLVAKRLDIPLCRWIHAVVCFSGCRALEQELESRDASVGSYLWNAREHHLLGGVAASPTCEEGMGVPR